MFSSYGRRALSLSRRPSLPFAATRKPPAPWKVRDAFLIMGCGLAYLVTLLIVTLGLFQLQAVDGQAPDIKAAVSGFVLAGFYLFLLWLIWMLIVKRYRCTWRTVGLRFAGWQWIAAVPLVFALLTFSFVLMYRGMVAVFGPAVHWPRVLTSTTVDAAHQPLLDAVVILTGVILTPLTEELLFRGVLYQALRRSMPVGGAALLSALIFAAMHFTLALFIPLTVMGLVLALLYERSGSLLPSMLVHACNNAIILIIIAGSQSPL